MYLLQDGPAQTSEYMIAGYMVIFGMMGLYWLSIVIRRRNLIRELETLKEIDGELK